MKNILLPADYVRRKEYRTNPIYKATWYVLFALFLFQFLAGGLYYFQWRSLGASKVQLESTRQEQVALANQKTKLAPTQVQLDSINVWARNKRYSITPLLIAIERTVPDELGVTEISLVQEGIDQEKRAVKLEADKRASVKKLPNAKPEPPSVIATSSNFVITIRGVSAVGTDDRQHALIDEWIEALTKVLPGVVQVTKRYNEDLAPKTQVGPGGFRRFEIFFKFVNNA